MARGSGFSGPGRHPAGARSFRLPLPRVLAILPPSFSDIGDYTDRATSRITDLHRSQIPVASPLKRKYGRVPEYRVTALGCAVWNRLPKWTKGKTA
jgi:hypothetical protein